MGNVYAVDAEQNLILYTTGKYICLRTAIGENLTRPIVLCNDYASGLSDLVYHNTVYYAYQNINRDIILRSVIEQDDLYQISSRNTPDCFSPQIAAVGKTLLLFYFVKNPIDNSYCLKSLLPLQPEEKFSVPGALFSAEEEQTAQAEAVFPSLPALHILSVDGMLLLHLSHDAKTFVITIDESLRCGKLLPEDSAAPVELARYEEEKKALLADTENQITKLLADLAGRDQVIQSIRSQYEELMDTAMKYREEAVKWHDKFYNR
ncbi:MAG: hypothetical protein NC302_09900 [Bacteroidales bacterium]|nr:hypothetical protein [Bacteroidales bacterium]MCM1416908.1 hypothetical protein [bacterium]MCM1424475.1 hypothetical protein [bacterium]